MTATERRRVRRKGFRRVVEVVGRGPDGSEQKRRVRARDVSTLGIFLHDSAPFCRPGDIVGLRFLVDEGGTEIHVDARVVRLVGPLDTADERMIGIGLEFVDVPGWVKAEIARYVEEARDESG